MNVACMCFNVLFFYTINTKCTLQKKNQAFYYYIILSAEWSLIYHTVTSVKSKIVKVALKSYFGISNTEDHQVNGSVKNDVGPYKIYKMTIYIYLTLHMDLVNFMSAVYLFDFR